MKKEFPMGLTCLTLALAASLSLPVLFEAQAGEVSLQARLGPDQIEVVAGIQLIIAYKYASSQKYPYLFPVNGPMSGQSVTTESAEPYPHHHSLFFACDRVNGGNYWQEGNERGQILSQGPKIEEAEGARVVIVDECLWKLPEEEAVMKDRRRITVSAPSESLRLIDLEIALEPLVDITIEKTNHSLFAARMVPELSVPSGGVLVNAQGDLAEAGTFGVASPWCDYSGSRNGILEGLAILQHPANRWYPAKWFTRDYGFFSPTPMYWPEGDCIKLPKGEVVTLRYRVVVHAGDMSRADLAAMHERYAAE
jgi:hypothetical protein